MPSTRSALFALAATGCVASSANAFWLIPGSHHTDNRAAQLAADQTATQRFRSVIAEKYNAVADAAANIVPGSATPAAKPATHSVYDDLIRALEEVTTDVGYSASLAKGTLVKGIYVRQDDDAYLLAMDVPGLHTREVEVTAEKGTLKIHGERKCPTVVATGKPDPLCIPRVYDATFTFPSDANEEKADAKLDAGVVKVFVPKIKGEARGLGRVIKLSGDAAEWVYEGTGAKTVVDATSEGINSAGSAAKNAYDSAAAQAAAAAAEASATAANAYNAAAETVERVVSNVAGTVKGASDSAQIAAENAAASAKSAGHAATASVKSAGSAATNSAQSAASKASAAAAASASAASASIKSAASVASASAVSATRAASASASSASAAASKSLSSAASAATATETPGFVEKYVKPIKERIYPTGAAEGNIHINKEEL
ncbi:hypothetical protein PhCBS80983_g01416 [Powellomyces hirtus]|uniref:SHSP domain-containing protein n=1 Tax=Powellomyces hirtus TaxID=109895 RepID=A0A507EAM8_9FUNG|nr:hypothetical protein PhCBS80983_g01416 [Powellomyces hirtus]